jgi:hypothetical protein
LEDIEGRTVHVADTYAKPRMSYAQLIAEALMNASDGMLTLSEIYQAIRWRLVLRISPILSPQKIRTIFLNLTFRSKSPSEPDKMLFRTNINTWTVVLGIKGNIKPYFET